MARWHKHVAERAPVSPEEAAQALEAAKQRAVRAEKGRQQRAPIFAEAERLYETNGIYDDLIRSLQLKGSST